MRGRLDGIVVATTRDGAADDPLVRALKEEGADVRIWPTIATREPTDPHPLVAALHTLDAFDWIVFTSARAVDAVARRVGVAPLRTRVAAVGTATAGALSARGWRVDVVGPGAGAHVLAATLAEAGLEPGSRVLFPAGSLARDTLERELTAHGAKVERVEAYHTEGIPPDADAVRSDLEGGVDVVTFASPSAVHALAASFDGKLAAALDACDVVAIGPTTGAALDELGCTRVHVAAEANVSSVVDACATVTPTS